MERNNVFYQSATRYGGSSAVTKRREAARRSFFTIKEAPSMTKQETMSNLVQSYTIGDKDIIRNTKTEPHLTKSAHRILMLIEQTSSNKQEKQLTKRNKFNAMHRAAPFPIRIAAKHKTKPQSTIALCVEPQPAEANIQSESSQVISEPQPIKPEEPKPLTVVNDWSSVTCAKPETIESKTNAPQPAFSFASVFKKPESPTPAKTVSQPPLDVKKPELPKVSSQPPLSFTAAVIDPVKKSEPAIPIFGKRQATAVPAPPQLSFEKTKEPVGTPDPPIFLFGNQKPAEVAIQREQSTVKPEPQPIKSKRFDSPVFCGPAKDWPPMICTRKKYAEPQLLEAKIQSGSSQVISKPQQMIPEGLKPPGVVNDWSSITFAKPATIESKPNIPQPAFSFASVFKKPESPTPPKTVPQPLSDVTKPEPPKESTQPPFFFLGAANPIKQSEPSIPIFGKPQSTGVPAPPQLSFEKTKEPVGKPDPPIFIFGKQPASEVTSQPEQSTVKPETQPIKSTNFSSPVFCDPAKEWPSITSTRDQHAEALPAGTKIQTESSQVISEPQPIKPEEPKPPAVANDWSSVTCTKPETIESKPNIPPPAFSFASVFKKPESPTPAKPVSQAPSDVTKPELPKVSTQTPFFFLGAANPIKQSEPAIPIFGKPQAIGVPAQPLPPFAPFANSAASMDWSGSDWLGSSGNQTGPIVGMPATTGPVGLPTTNGSIGMPTTTGPVGLPTTTGPIGLPTTTGPIGLPTAIQPFASTSTLNLAPNPFQPTTTSVRGRKILRPHRRLPR